MNNKNDALNAEKKFLTSVEEAQEYIENFDILETINNVGNDEVFTPVKVCQQMLDILPDEVWTNPNYKWLNPCDKNGVFLREIALRLDEGLMKWEPDEEKRRKHILQNMLYSIGLTRFTAQVSRRTVYYCSQANRKFDGKVDADGHSINGYAIGNGEWFDNSEGNILDPVHKHIYPENKNNKISKTQKCVFCSLNKDSIYNDENQIEHYAYDFIHDKNIIKYLAKKFGRGDTNMKFDIIIGNPPYQLKVNEGGKGLGAIPIYHLFIEQAIKLNPKYIAMIVPSRWFAGGVGLNDFRNNFLNDTRMSKIVDFANSKDCFPGFDINGGVNYFLWDRDKKSNTIDFTNISNGIRSRAGRIFNEFDVFIRSNEAVDIIHKVLFKNEEKLSDEISSQTPYGLISSFRGEEKKFNDSLAYYSSEGRSFVAKKDVVKGLELINNYRVMMPKLTSEHAGIPDKDGRYKVFTQMSILKPNEICSQSYLVVGPYKSFEIASNAKKYLETKFVRFLLWIALPGMNISKDKFNFVPKQDFQKKWDDDELFRKYNLTSKEIEYINSIIKEI